MGIYLGEFEDEWSVRSEFSPEWANANALPLRGAEILFAVYDQGSYAGEAFVVIRRDDKLYSIEASHCSCYGLEHQWEEVETTKETLALRVSAERKYGWDKQYENEFSSFVNSLP